MSVVPAHTAPTRDPTFDILRFVALLGIILAHVDPPKWLYQLRNFDVPLIVLVSGAVFGLSSGRSMSYGEYLRKRVLRIVLPVWIFFAWYFAWSGGFAALIGVPQPFSWQTIAMTYLFQVGFGGIAYVWLLNVFIVMALLTPLIFRIHRSVPSDAAYLSGILGVFLCYLGVVAYWKAAVVPSLPIEIVETVQFNLLMVVPYACLVAFGLRLPTLSRTTIATIAAASCGVFLMLAAWYHGFRFPQYVGDVLWTQKFKYPPDAYYLSFALAFSLALYLAVDAWHRWPPRALAFVHACSRSTLWIYLWHIFFLSVSKHLPWADVAIERFPFVVVLSITAALVQRAVAQNIVRAFPSATWLPGLAQHVM